MLLSNRILVKYLPYENQIISNGIIIVSSMHQDTDKIKEKGYICQVVEVGNDVKLNENLVKDDFVLCERNLGTKLNKIELEALGLPDGVYYLYRDPHIICKYENYERRADDDGFDYHHLPRFLEYDPNEED